MRYVHWRAALLAVTSMCNGQSGLSPEILLLARIKDHMARTLARQPNYTCMQSIERSRRRAPTQKYEPLDTIRLEVALVGGSELFSWPGARKFEDAKISDLVRGGAIGNGNFALHARSIFLSNIPAFTYVGERIRDGRATVRFDYVIPQYRSGYRLKIGELEGIAGYHGSFWVDAATLDLVRLEVIAREIPPHLPISFASDAIDYARLKIGDGEFLLPVSSDMTIADLRQNESRNRTRFLNCRQYAGESVLTFEDPPETGPAATKGAVEIVELPAGLELDLKLMTALDSASSAVGDLVEAAVDRAAKYNGAVVIPKNAKVTGRISRLEHRREPAAHYIIGLEFSTLEFEGHRADLNGSIASVSRLFAATGRTSTLGQLASAYRNPEEGTFLEPGTRVRLPRGLRIVWRARPANKEENK